MTPEKAIEAIAARNGVTADEVRREIQLAIDLAMQDSDPETRKLWESIPSKGDKPTPEELILGISRNISGN
ncbi:MAG: hypothetical protein IJX77_08300 [Ruminococcus sp.]|nr:hypothetical protein [Ruminococcus sp.]